MKRLIYLIFFLFPFRAFAQSLNMSEGPSTILDSIGQEIRAIKTEVKKIVDISVVADMYWRYSSGLDAQNNYTSFASDHNSFSFGMIQIDLKKDIGNVSFVGSLSFGTRSFESLPDASAFPIQSLYMTYSPVDPVSISFGYMGTFVGYELISPSANFHYSTSYLFTYGPFQQAGVKVSYSFTEAIKLMIGVFNDWNVFIDDDGIDNVGAQLEIAPFEGLSIYLNYTSDFGVKNYGYELDLVVAYQVSENVSFGLNGAYNSSDEGKMFYGGVFYTSYKFSDVFSLGCRYEHFYASKENGIFKEGQNLVNANVDAITLSANISKLGLRIIPEIRVDFSDKKVFVDEGAGLSSIGIQGLIAVVYTF